MEPVSVLDHVVRAGGDGLVGFAGKVADMAPDMPGWAYAGADMIGVAMASAQNVCTWVDFGPAPAAIGFVMLSWAVGVGIHIARMAISAFTLGGIM